MTTPAASANPSPAARIDPRAARSRELVLDAALDYFLEHGYLAATVDGVAAAAGVAKRTVYNLFISKDELFRAVIRRATETAERFVAERVESAVGTGPVEEEIAAFAVSHARAVVAPRVVTTRRLLIGEAQRFPELAAEYFDRVPNAVIAAIAARLKRYDALGLLTVPDARTAAEHFAYLVLGASLDRALFDADAIDPEGVERGARAGAAAFLRAYR
ncbi:TetR/AcrR family transcriptional regulator [Herbiconiux sp. P17]|uniref:TetR/AcrR family transcriptional regulator n=1 Tax=Herbiconiux wuyangfengii TaxID=3342794 RepID=UPI0035B8668B